SPSLDRQAGVGVSDRAPRPLGLRQRLAAGAGNHHRSRRPRRRSRPGHEERPVPSSDIPGEQAAGTQPFTAVTPPLSPHRFSADSIWGTTDADRAACHAAIDGLRNEGIFTPPSTQGTMMMPSNIGGAHWGGVAVDPIRQIAVVPVNRVAAVVQLIPRDSFDHARAMADDKRLGTRVVEAV